MKVKQFEFNAFSENTYIVYDETNDCIIIDPGCYDQSEQSQLRQFIRDNDLTVKMLINTHCHIDHVLGNNFVKNEFKLGLTIHKKDKETLKANEIVAPLYGFQGYEPCEPDHFIEEGDQIKFGNSTLDVLFVPGHAAGHIALVNENEKVCFGGDVLFRQSIGRTDLPGGDFNTLMDSIKSKLFKLRDDVTVYCGHGPSTTVGEEKTHNPFCGEKVNY
jgi:hydroxyacylglutathione hydrolase